MPRFVTMLGGVGTGMLTPGHGGLCLRLHIPISQLVGALGFADVLSRCGFDDKIWFIPPVILIVDAEAAPWRLDPF